MMVLMECCRISSSIWASVLLLSGSSLGCCRWGLVRGRGKGRDISREEHELTRHVATARGLVTIRRASAHECSICASRLLAGRES